MTKLEMHQRLQGFYSWIPKEGDRVTLDGDNYTGFITKIKDKKDGGYVYVRWSDGKESCDKPSFMDEFIWLPLPIDPVNPERGLWGMVDWSKLRYEQWGPDGELAIFKLPYIQFNEEMGIPVKDHPFIVAEPETALLMALLAQEGL